MNGARLSRGGAGETVRRKLLAECDVHTLLRLPTGIFYAQGVKANVLFFDRKPASETPWTKDLWIYDFRTNLHFTRVAKPLMRADLDDFVACYNSNNRLDREETKRFRYFSYDDLIKRDKANLDIFWLRDESMEDSANLPPPDIIAEEILEDLRAALEQLEEIAGDLAGEPVKGGGKVDHVGVSDCLNCGSVENVPSSAFRKADYQSMEGVMDVSRGNVRASSPGLHGGRDERSGSVPGVWPAPGHGAQAAGLLGAPRIPTPGPTPPAQA